MGLFEIGKFEQRVTLNFFRFEKVTTSKSIISKVSEFENEHFEKRVTSKNQSAKCVISKMVTSITESLRNFCHFENKSILNWILRIRGHLERSLRKIYPLEIDYFESRYFENRVYLKISQLKSNTSKKEISTENFSFWKKVTLKKITSNFCINCYYTK